ncbi:hypothetical protein AAZV13_08G222100 [Glycine max]
MLSNLTFCSLKFLFVAKFSLLYNLDGLCYISISVSMLIKGSSIELKLNIFQGCYRTLFGWPATFYYSHIYLYRFSLNNSYISCSYQGVETCCPEMRHCH